MNVGCPEKKKEKDKTKGTYSEPGGLAKKCIGPANDNANCIAKAQQLLHHITFTPKYNSK